VVMRGRGRPVEFHLDLLRGDGTAAAAVHDPDGRAVRFTPGCDAKELSECCSPQ